MVEVAATVVPLAQSDLCCVLIEAFVVPFDFPLNTSQQKKFPIFLVLKECVIMRLESPLNNESFIMHFSVPWAVCQLSDQLKIILFFFKSDWITHKINITASKQLLKQFIRFLKFHVSDMTMWLWFNICHEYKHFLPC